MTTRRATLLTLCGGAAAVAVGASASQALIGSPLAVGATGGTAPAEGLNRPYTDAAGTASTYHLYTSRAVATKGSLDGLAVYLDGDGMYGYANPSSTWALGGSRGLVAQGAAFGYAVAAIRTPDRRGTPTFWEDGAKNAAYVASLTSKLMADLQVSSVWLVGYSGGSQLITKFLMPAHGAMFTQGGAIITGGGGRPSGTSLPTATPQQRATFPMLWRTGLDDDGTTADDGYNALADARRGEASYRERGFTTAREEPAGVDHSDLGTTFGGLLARQLAAHPSAPRTTPAPSSSSSAPTSPATSSAPPPTITAQPLDSEGVVVRWSSATSPGNGWSVARDGVDLDGDGPWTNHLPGTARSSTFLRLRPGTTYTFTLTNKSTGEVARVSMRVG